MEVVTQNSEIDLCLKQINERCLLSGGFSENLHGLCRPDSTAWAILALAMKEGRSPSADFGRDILVASQRKDGRIAFLEMRDVFWPTAIAILAWHGASKYNKAKYRAINFLLKTAGTHPRFNPNSPIAHDSSIKGWPWTDETHSFVYPTALALLALEVTGQSSHPRFIEGVNMVMNRQLPHGGWNYGNTLVYGKELRPFVDTTGIALAALAGHVERKKISSSLNYLKTEAEQARTALSLAWALFGLGGWGEFPRDGFAWIDETLKKQAKYGPYGTSLLSILALAQMSRGDIRKCISNKDPQLPRGSE